MTDRVPAGQPSLLARLRPRKVVLFRASRIGDFVCATPAFRAFRAALPDAEITLVGLPLVADLAARCPSLDRFEPFPGMPGIAEQFFEARRSVEFFGRLQAERFDVAVQMHGSGVYANPIVLMFGARATAGFVRPGDPPGRLDAALPMPTGMPEIARLLALAEFLGAPSCGSRTEIAVWLDDRQRAAAALAGTVCPLVGLHAGARDAIKRWAPDRFAETANRLLQHHGGTAIVLGGPEEAERCSRVAACLRVPHVDLQGTRSLGEVAATVARLDLLISNDSGPAHLAYAFGTPTVTIFGGTDPHRWRPLVPGPFRFLSHDVDCRPCDYASCPLEQSCLDDVTVDEVVAAAAELITARKNAIARRRLPPRRTLS